MNHQHAIQNPVFVGLIRRLVAIFYDLFLLLAILFIVTATLNALNHGEAIDSNNPYYVFFVRLLLLAISFFYYGWFWTHGGQTLGMKTWKIKLQSCHKEGQNQNNISWLQALTRASVAFVSAGLFGLGFAWALIDKKKRAWHDIASKTELIDQN